MLSLATTRLADWHETSCSPPSAALGRAAGLCPGLSFLGYHLSGHQGRRRGISAGVVRRHPRRAGGADLARLCRLPGSIGSPGATATWAAIGVGVLLFLGGNFLITIAEKTLASSVAAVLVATTPLWIGLVETVWPGGERLSGRGWLGVLAGLGGVLLLFAPQLHDPKSSFSTTSARRWCWPRHSAGPRDRACFAGSGNAVLIY